MSLRITEAETSKTAGQDVFISASIPDPSRWDGDFDPLAITDAVVALARVFLTAGWRLVSAAHPTIAPLLLYVASELPIEGDRRVAIYQSKLFEDVLPTATRRFEAEGIGTFVWTEAVEGETTEPGNRERSLELMRRQMLSETEPDAAVFIGGMGGIPDEYALFETLRPGRPRYLLGSPGGAAADLARARPTASVVEASLLDGVVYPSLARAILEDLEDGQ
jgi:hypothetical protein